MTGVASLALDGIINLNEFSHGQDPAQCLKVRNPSAVDSDLIAVVKITDQSQDDGNTHLRLAVPGYDDLQKGKICCEKDVITND